MNCSNGWGHKYYGGDHCHKCGAERKYLKHKRPTRKFLFHQESADGWVHMDLLIQAWGTDLKPKRELLRCASNGIIHVWKDGEWLDDQFTDLTLYQQHKIRQRCWGQAFGYESLDRVPRLQCGARFWIRGTPEQDGLWRCVAYREGFLVAHRLLPDYNHCPDRTKRIKNTSWPSQQDSSSSALTESSTTPPSSTETKTE